MDQKIFERWLDAYGAAWEARDSDAFAAVFTEDATYQWTPFEEPKHGRQEIGDAFWDAVEGQRNIHFRYRVLSVSGDLGVCRWWCEFERVSGVHVALDGIFVCQLTTDELCCQFQEWWHRQES